MNQAWKVETTFSGTRSTPEKSGSIFEITEQNFNPGALTLGIIQGILQELFNSYSVMKNLTGKNAKILVGSGNGIRKNKLMQKLAENLFEMPLNIPIWKEEAACGAALCGMAKTGLTKSISEAQSKIQYE